MHAEGPECYAAYKQRNAEACVFCGEKIIHNEDKAYSGTAIKTQEGETIHVECHDAYRLNKAPKCLHCQKAVSAVGGHFSGKFFEIVQPSGIVHVECHDQFEASLK